MLAALGSSRGAGGLPDHFPLPERSDILGARFLPVDALKIGLIFAATLTGFAQIGTIYEGPVEVIVADDFSGGGSVTTYRFERDGQTVVAQGALPAIGCGDRVRLEGPVAGGVMRVRTARVTGHDATADCSSVGIQKTAVLVVTFPGVTPPVTNTSALHLLMFDQTALSVNTWYGGVSYGQATFVGSVFGPFTLDRAYSCQEDSAMRAAAIRVAAGAVDFSLYQRYVMVFPPITGCGVEAWSTLGCTDFEAGGSTRRGSWVWMNYRPDSTWTLNLMIHELGHSLGVGHARMLRFPGSTLEADDGRAEPVEYGDWTSVMGNGGPGDFAAAHKVALGWLPESDVPAVEADADFVLAPLMATEGVRALRVRRRVGSDEWLWLEYRKAGQPGVVRVNGLVVRRVTDASDTRTNLLDLTPAPLDDARVDLGVASEKSPELAAGSTWTDPHSGLTIRTGAATPAGLPVSIRYQEPCAVPERTQLTVGAAAQAVVVPVRAEAGCAWTAESGRAWLRASRQGGAVVVRVQEAADAFPRTGTVTIGRQAVTVLQRGPERAPEVLTVSPPGPGWPAQAPVPLVVGYRDENGMDEVEALLVALVPPAGSAAKPCYFRYDGTRHVVGVSDDGETFADADGAVARSGSCSLSEASLFLPNRTDVYLRASVQFDGAAGEPLSILARTEEGAGARGPWLAAASMTTVTGCQALPWINYLLYLAAGSASQALPVRVTESPCAWTLRSDAPWIRVSGTSGNDSTAAAFSVDANPERVTREAQMWVNDAPVRVVQFGDGELQPNYVTLWPAETVVSGLAGRGEMTYSYGLQSTVPVEPESPWLRVLPPFASGGSRVVQFEFDANPEAAARVGSLQVGGHRYTVVQQAGPAATEQPPRRAYR